jgi:hypothetical protein
MGMRQLWMVSITGARTRTAVGRDQENQKTEGGECQSFDTVRCTHYSVPGSDEIHLGWKKADQSVGDQRKGFRLLPLTLSPSSCKKLANVTGQKIRVVKR